jgi:hypothetical protein
MRKAFFMVGKRSFFYAIWGILLVALFTSFGSMYYEISIFNFTRNFLRVVSSPILGVYHRGDVGYISTEVASYYRGPNVSRIFDSPQESWDTFSELNGSFEIIGREGNKHPENIPFVYQPGNAVHLVNLRKQCRLDEIVGDGTEYQKMLRLFHWVGTRFDHGVDSVPGGAQTFHPLQVVVAGENGRRFWCEIAARLTVQAASSMGWPARLMTASKDGYNWDHALAEVWSNQFNKWVLVDTDFNVLYESNGIPLSGFELCHHGSELKTNGLLEVLRIAPLKSSLSDVDLLPFYRYVHIDLRNDWLGRLLSPGSPAGGDLATWWTARKDLGPILTARVRVDNESQFDWPVNWVEFYFFEKLIFSEETTEIKLGLRGYSPYFRYFALRLDDNEWVFSEDGLFQIPIFPGEHIIEAKIITENESEGPVSIIKYVSNENAQNSNLAP